ncbi:hypothetical protein NM688_g7870 [Phlebia brevispora]|uniref:Uncharacterized protein n=1 Tax=Phlebia brevispora TaxID=194682 RepID=A0ACC1S068_9APHY|nr:hypothetical protein NM688_g7870 [Phlebia brevispora]
MRHSLPEGYYTIVSQASDYVVGRKLAEEFSYTPKAIFTLGTAAEWKYGARSLWEFEHIQDGLYKLQVGSDPVGNRGGLLFASLTKQDDDIVGEWRIEHVPQMGKDAIQLHDRSVGWVASAENAPQNKQIELKALIAYLMEPTRYLPTEVFIIKPAKPEDEQ